MWGGMKARSVAKFTCYVAKSASTPTVYNIGQFPSVLLVKRDGFARTDYDTIKFV